MSNYEKIVDYNNLKLVTARRIVDYRRINWFVASKIINEAFKSFMEECAKSKFPYLFKVIEYNNHPNESTIELKCVKYPNTNLRKLNPKSGENPNVFETGGTLVATQCWTGHIIFTFYPLRTEKTDTNYKEVLLSGLIEPNDISCKVLKKTINKFMVLMRYSSLHGIETLNSLEKIKVLFIFILDMRNILSIRSSAFRLKNEWAKILLTNIILVVLAYLGLTSGNS